MGCGASVRKDDIERAPLCAETESNNEAACSSQTGTVPDSKERVSSKSSSISPGSVSLCDKGEKAEGEGNQRGHPPLTVACHRDDVVHTVLSSGEKSPVQSERSYIDLWARPEQTLLLMDWDDTCFPTSTLGSARCQTEPQWWQNSQEFSAYCDAVVAFLRDAAENGTVKILTMGTEEWIKSCFEMLQGVTPDFATFLADLGVEVVYARHFMSAGVKRECRDVSHYLKTRAMSKVIKAFYARRDPDEGEKRKHSWKNIMSIGDSPAERLALQDVVFRHEQRSRDGTWKNYRYKTLTLLDRPDLVELTSEIRTVHNWLSTLLLHDGDMDIEFDSETMSFRGSGLPCPQGSDLPDAVSDTLVAA